MTGGAGPLQYAPHSRVFSCVPLDCVSQCTIDSFVSSSQSCGSSRVALQQAFDALLACFAVSLMSSLANSQIPAPGTTLAETPLLEVCPAKVGPRYLVFHQLFSCLGAPSQRLSPLQLGCRTHCHLECSVSVPSLRHGHSPDVRRPCLDRQ